MVSEFGSLGSITTCVNSAGVTYSCVEFQTTSLFTSRLGTYTFNVQAELTQTPSITGSSILATIEVVCGAE